SITVDPKGDGQPQTMTLGQREWTFSRLAFVFSKLIIMAENRSFIPIWQFENCNPLIFCAGIIGIKGLSKTVGSY
ncbi:hypothetical protein, partial [Acidithiobacillus caldus]|uniref:hypothetical protein n=1 Tax=Acidithiobacillus caldus TaxID=33059 RepID=UPI001C075B31